MAKNKPAITRLICNKCVAEVSGPIAESVTAAMKRHIQKKHGNQPLTARAKDISGGDS